MLRRIFSMLVLLWMLPEAVKAAPFGAECRAGAGDYVVLVHGLDWFRDTMEPAAEFLNAEGYETVNVRYPSRKIDNPEEAARWVRTVVENHCTDSGKQIHIVAHSMGTLVVREYLAAARPSRLGRVVLLAAPNQGTRLADALQWKPLAKLVSPAAALCCGAKRRGTVLPEQADFAPGILMGNQSGWFPYFSVFLKGPDDGVVPVSSGRIDGMADFRVVRASHTRMPHAPAALREVTCFLKSGRFSDEGAAKGSPSPAGSIRPFRSGR